MGFEVPTSVLNLTFDEYPDLEVRAGSITLARLLDLTEQAEGLRKDAGSASEARELFAEFGGKLRSWNCERDGEPIPATLDGLLSLDADFAAKILLSWFDAIGGTDIDKGPLDRRSTNGLPSVAPMTIPTEVLSAPPLSWPMPA